MVFHTQTTTCFMRQPFLLTGRTRTKVPVFLYRRSVPVVSKKSFDRALFCFCSALALDEPGINEREMPSTQKTDDKTTRTIVITSGKGGVGKTTTTANLGMSIARLGYRVTLIDADIGLRNLDLLLGLENRVLYTAMDIFEGDCRLDQALIRDKRLKNLCLLAISKNRQRYNVTRQKMDSLISSICALGSDFILIDCPAGIDIGFINAISLHKELRPPIPLVHGLWEAPLCVIEENFCVLLIANHELVPASPVHTPVVQIFLQSTMSLAWGAHTHFTGDTSRNASQV